MARQRAGRHGALECSASPLTRVLLSPSARAAMDGRRSSTVVRTPLARGDARLVPASNPILPAKALLLLLHACCCCSSLTSALVSSRARVSRRVAARSKDRAPRPSAVAASDRRTERQPFNGALRSTAGSGCLTWSWSPARPGAGARGGAADERAAGARAAGGESTSQPPPSTTPVLLSAGWSLAATARDNYRDGVSRR